MKNVLTQQNVVLKSHRDVVRNADIESKRLEITNDFSRKSYFYVNAAVCVAAQAQVNCHGVQLKNTVLNYERFQNSCSKNDFKTLRGKDRKLIRKNNDNARKNGEQEKYFANHKSSVN